MAQQQFPSPSLAKRMSFGADQLLSELKVPFANDKSPVTQYVDFLIHRFKELFVKKHGENYGKGNDDIERRNLETFGRYLQLNFNRVIRLDRANGGPAAESLKPIPSHEERLLQGSFYPKEWRFRFPDAERASRALFGESISLVCPRVPVGDLTIARVWFSSNRSIDSETTWELYKRYDPDGVRAMHQGQFYSLLPRAWREMEQYQRTGASYQDCTAAEKWFTSITPIPGETTWKLYKRYDPDGVRAMHQGHFYSLLPKEWREVSQYLLVKATYRACLAVDRWCQNIEIKAGDDVAALYKRYTPPNPDLAVSERDFSLLLSAAWRKQLGLT